MRYITFHEKKPAIKNSNWKISFLRLEALGWNFLITIRLQNIYFVHSHCLIIIIPFYDPGKIESEFRHTNCVCAANMAFFQFFMFLHFQLQNSFATKIWFQIRIQHSTIIAHIIQIVLLPILVIFCWMKKWFFLS